MRKGKNLRSKAISAVMAGTLLAGVFLSPVQTLDVFGAEPDVEVVATIPATEVTTEGATGAEGASEVTSEVSSEVSTETSSEVVTEMTADETIAAANAKVAEAETEIANGTVDNSEAENQIAAYKGIDITLEEYTDIETEANAAESSYDEVTTEATEVKESLDSINTKTTSQKTAETIIATAKEDLAAAQEKYEATNEVLADAQDTYDAAKEKLDAAVANADATQDEIDAAEQDLADAEALLASVQEEVETAKTEKEAAYNALKTNLYQQITEAQETLAAMDGTEDTYAAQVEALAQKIVEYYILTGDADAKNITFSEKDTTYISGYTEKEDGTFEPVYTTVTNKIVTYTDADGKVVTKIYDFEENEESVLSISEKTESSSTEDVVLREAVEESYATADGTEYEATTTTHIILIDSEDATKGFYAIDTADQDSVVSETTNGEPQGYVWENTTVTYEKTGDEVATYTKSEYTVVDSYNTKTVTVPKPAKNKGELKNIIDGLQEGETATVTVRALGFMWEVDVDPSDPNWFENFSAWLNRIGGGNGFTVNISKSVDDTNSPKDTHQEDGITETVTQDYVKTTTVVDSYSSDSSSYNDRASATNAMNEAITSLQNQGYVVTSSTVESETHWEWVEHKSFPHWRYEKVKTYYYTISYTKTTTTTETVTETVRTTTYAADTYNQYTAPVEEVKAPVTTVSYEENEVITTQDETLVDVLATQKENLEAAETAKTNATTTKTNYDAAVAAVEAAKEKLAALVAAKEATDAEIEEAEAELEVAETALADATIAKEEAEAALEDANAALDTANAKLKTIIANNVVLPTIVPVPETTPVQATVTTADASTDATDTTATTATVTTRRTTTTAATTNNDANADADADANADADAAADITDEETPLAANDDAEDTAADIADEETPLSANEQGVNLGLLFALLAAALVVLTAAGTTVYKKLKIKKPN